MVTKAQVGKKYVGPLGVVEVKNINERFVYLKHEGTPPLVGMLHHHDFDAVYTLKGEGAAVSDAQRFVHFAGVLSRNDEDECDRLSSLMRRGVIPGQGPTIEQQRAAIDEHMKL